ncbi:23S ribosomal RNA methyltransferase Erm [Streptomyces sp. RY43-2]|uniref:23S ribosomal RNA methyltransferase Erm n=1 Tax=Streptomyces macrolidinus TaxID=2952607 RepID=A0ABT0ZMH9_9ACTN|nr:23S ribosomal RNA methyltransferase Erm [Streptomyces macrolidinus]MCN9244792.1 23S ribosomal RNA methyltransferase Erm [Streptomyces macrolidinus]
MPFPSQGGRHELGQNFLTDHSVIGDINAMVARTKGPILEIGPGDGALTLPLSKHGRSITAVEIDARRARRLDARTPGHVTVVHHDFMNFPLPRNPHVVVGNLPFHLTTAIMRRLLDAQHWHTAVLLVQWEVARRRAGVGGTTLLTAGWAPWYEFDLHSRVPAQAFRPVPNVDGGLLRIRRRSAPLVDSVQPYQDFVRQVFTGRGNGLKEIIKRNGRVSQRDLAGWLRHYDISPHALPKDLKAHHWASLWHLAEAAPAPVRPREQPHHRAAARRRKVQYSKAQPRAHSADSHKY